MINKTPRQLERERIKNILVADRPTTLSGYVQSFVKIHNSGGPIRLRHFFEVIDELNLKVVVNGKGFDVEACGLRPILEAKIGYSEFDVDFHNAAATYPDFSHSEAYVYVRQFVEKYGNSYGDEYSNFILLMKNRGCEFSDGELRFFVEEEFRNQKVEKVRSLLLLRAPSHDRKDIIDTYLTYWRIDDIDSMSGLGKALKEQGLWFDGLETLKSEITGIERERELEAFESQLKGNVSEEAYDVNETFLINEGFRTAAAKHPDFPESEAYLYVRQFVKRYGGNESKDDLSKLQILLSNRNWRLSLGELMFFTEEEHRKQSRQRIKDKVLSNCPQNRKELIESYLDFVHSDDVDGLEILVEIFQEKGLVFEDVTALGSEVTEVANEIELRLFEERLAAESEVIAIGDVDQLGGFEFEGFLRTLFEKMGYRVEQTRLSGDQGADLVVVKFGEKTVIQAKRSQGSIGNYAVQEIMGAISLYQADYGMVVTNNYFTQSARDLSIPNNIGLIDREKLVDLINKYW